MSYTFLARINFSSHKISGFFLLPFTRDVFHLIIAIHDYVANQGNRTRATCMESERFIHYAKTLNILYTEVVYVQ